jgi:hypothetical protein
MDILRSKMKSSVMPDAMVMRTIFDVIDSPPKFNSNFKNKLLTPDCIGLEILLFASSLVSNQTYQFDTEGAESADKILQDHQDMFFASSTFFQITDLLLAFSSHSVIIFFSHFGKINDKGHYFYLSFLLFLRDYISTFARLTIICV